MKWNGREPAAGMQIMKFLLQRGDVVSADSLKPPSKDTARSSYSFGSFRSTISSYIWGSPTKTSLSLDDPIVPVAALKAAAERVSSLSGPVASSDIHTVQSFASVITAGNTRDAEAVIAHIVNKGDASALFTDPSADNPSPVFGVKLGKSPVNPADKGVLRTKDALERMTQLSQHLEIAVQAEKEAATTAAKAGNKSDALNRLRKKKVLETKLTGARSAASKLSDVLMAVDETESNREAVVALETGMASLKMVNEAGVTADRVDAVAADFDDMLSEQAEVRTALEQLNGATETDALLEEELEELMTEETEKPQPKKTITDEAEEELIKLLSELNPPSASTTQVPDPVKAALANSSESTAPEKQAAPSEPESESRTAEAQGV